MSRVPRRRLAACVLRFGDASLDPASPEALVAALASIGADDDDDGNDERLGELRELLESLPPSTVEEIAGELCTMGGDTTPARSCACALCVYQRVVETIRGAVPSGERLWRVMGGGDA